MERPRDLDELVQALRQQCEEINATLGLDAVVLIASFRDAEGQTRRASAAAGNVHARFGSVLEWLIEEEKLIRDGIT